jgi:uncharacterized membrane protein
MKPIFSGLLGTGIAILALDGVWLSFMSTRFYRPRLGDLLAANFKIAPVLAFYAIYLFGVTRFAVLPAVQEGGWEKAALDGALLGLMAYATYDLTNLATLREWSWAVTIVDLLWGVLLTSVAAVVGYFSASLWR